MCTWRRSWPPAGRPLPPIPESRCSAPPGTSPGAACRGRHPRRQQAPAAVHRRDTVVPADVVLPHDAGARRARPSIQATSIHGGAVAYLAAQFGIKQVGYRDSIAVRCRTRQRPASSRSPRTGESRCSRSTGSALMRWVNASVSPSPCTPQTATGSSVTWARRRR